MPLVLYKPVARTEAGNNDATVPKHYYLRILSVFEIFQSFQKSMLLKKSTCLSLTDSATFRKYRQHGQQKELRASPLEPDDFFNFENKLIKNLC